MYVKCKILSKMWYYECIICILQTQRGRNNNEQRIPDIQDKRDCKYTDFL